MTMTHHDHWNVAECLACKATSIVVSNAKLHEQLVQLQNAVEEYLQSLDAKKKLDAGFRGMGQNILTEDAAMAGHHLHTLKRLVGYEDK